jgi:peptidoglycan/xylan/chitin deacetylase (PgdA/CDA1 family)
MGDVMVLCYHAVAPDWDSSLAVTPEEFEHQIGFLLGRGWQPTTFTAATLAPPAARALAITFDDAFASVKRYALPILRALEAPATMFAPTAFMDGASALRWNGIEQWLGTPSEPELAPLSWDELGELTEFGWEIGSHTCSHPRLTQLDDDALERELVESREACAERLGRPCTSIAYPYGNVNARVAKASARMGYTAGGALSSNLRRRGDLLQPRIGIYRIDQWRRFRVKMLRATRVVRATPGWPSGPH